MYSVLFGVLALCVFSVVSGDDGRYNARYNSGRYSPTSNSYNRHQDDDGQYRHDHSGDYRGDYLGPRIPITPRPPTFPTITTVYPTFPTSPYPTHFPTNPTFSTELNFPRHPEIHVPIRHRPHYPSNIPENQGYARILRYDNAIDHSGYHYAYDTENDIHVEEKGSVGPQDEVLRTSGFYQFVAPDGSVHRVDYTADENGFHPVVSHS